MRKEETLDLSALLSDAFEGGERRVRELRLGREEARAVKALPGVRVTALGESGREKTWYQVELRGERKS